MKKNSFFDIEKSVYFKFTSIYFIFLFILLAFWGNFFYQCCSSPTDNLNHLTFSYVILFLITLVFITHITPSIAFAAIITDLVLKKQIQSSFKINSNPVIRVLQYTFFILFHAIIFSLLSSYIKAPSFFLQLIPFALICSIIGIFIVSNILKAKKAVNEFIEQNEPQPIVYEKQDNRALIVITAIIINFLVFHSLACGIVYLSEAQNPNLYKNVEVTSKFFAPEQKIIHILTENPIQDLNNSLNIQNKP